MPKTKPIRNQCRIRPNPKFYVKPSEDTWACECCGQPNLVASAWITDHQAHRCKNCKITICDSCSLRDDKGTTYCTACPIFNEKDERLSFMKRCCQERAHPPSLWIVAAGGECSPLTIDMAKTQEAAIVHLHRHAMVMLDLQTPKPNIEDYGCKIHGDLENGNRQSFVFEDGWVEIHRK